MIDYWGVSIKAADGRKGAPKNQQYRWVKALGLGKSRECVWGVCGGNYRVGRI